VVEDWEVVTDAHLICWAVGLKVTLRFGRGTLRRGVAELSFIRIGEGDVAVEYVHGVRSDGCNRQPIAAVRRVGAVPSILGGETLGVIGVESGERS